MGSKETGRVARVEVRVGDPGEQVRIYERWRESGARTLSQFARACILGSPIRTVVLDKGRLDVAEALMRIAGEVRLVGVNVNQIARALNAYHTEEKARLLLARAEAHQLRVESLLGEAIALARRLDDAIR